MTRFNHYLNPSQTVLFLFLSYIMTTLTNSEGRVLPYTNELVETILSQLNSRYIYYTSGVDGITYIYS